MVNESHLRLLRQGSVPMKPAGHRLLSHTAVLHRITVCSSAPMATTTFEMHQSSMPFRRKISPASHGAETGYISVVPSSTKARGSSSPEPEPVSPDCVTVALNQASVLAALPVSFE